MPAAFAVGLLSPFAGDVGESAASFSGGISLNAALPTQGGRAVVDAANPVAAIQAALINTVTVTFAGQSAGYTPGATTVSITTTAQVPFLVVPTATPGVYELRLEDLANMPGVPPDWDYNDRTWTVSVTELAVVSVTAATAGQDTPDGSAPAVFTLTRSATSADVLSGPLVVPFTLGGTALPGVDYTPPSSYLAVFWPGQAVTKVVLPVVNDPTADPTKTIVITADPADGFVPGPTTTVGTTITDPGPVPPVPPSPTAEVWVSGSLDGEERADGLKPVVFQLSRTNPSGTAPALTVSFTLSGTASPVYDYAVPFEYTATFASGELTTTVVLTVSEDTDIEGTETVGFTITTGTTYTIGTPDQSIASLIDRPPPPPAPPGTTPPPATADVGSIAFETAKPDWAVYNQKPLNTTYTYTSGLKVAKWHGAFELAGSSGPPPGTRSAVAKPLDNWIYGDPDSYRVRYIEPAADTNNAQKNNPNQRDVRVLKLWTTRGNTVVEQERDMTFVETGNKTGIFRSRSFILVADAVDDEWNWTQNPETDIPGDNATDDPTIRVELGDKVLVKHGNAISAEREVPAKAEISVRIYSLSAVNPPVNLVPIQPIVSDEGVEDQIRYLKSSYAQFSIRVHVVKTNVWSPTWKKDGAVHNFDSTAAYVGAPAENDPQKKLQEGMVTELRDSDPANHAKYLHVYFIREVQGGNGLAYSPTRGFRTEQADAIFDRTLVIGKKGVDPDPVDNHPIDVMLLSHEVGHLLGLKHVVEKKKDDLTLTEAEALISRTGIMGTGTFLNPSALAHDSVVGMRRFSDAEQSGGVVNGSLRKGVYDQSNQMSGTVKFLK